MKNKVVFVTGASRGIGEAIADKFASMGYMVAYGYFSTPIEKDVFSVFVDISDRSSIKEALIKTEKHFNQKVSILINNGALAQEKPFLSITDEDWDRMLSVNLRGAFILTQEVISSMIDNKWGRIINISSIGGQWGGFNQVHYAASKAALINFTQSIAKIYSGSGITSNAVSPGLVSTDMSQNELNTPAGQDKVRNIPAKRLGKKEEVAATVFFLATEDAAYITGQTINLNGGMYFG